MYDGEESDATHLPVFASVPSKLDPRQAASKRYVYSQLRLHQLDPRTLGPANRGMFPPLHEVRTLARHCSGGIILGYSQITAELAKRLDFGPSGVGPYVERTIEQYHAPTPWNHLETGVLFGLGLPLFVLKQDSISGGIFDEGASDVLVHDMPMPGPGWEPGGNDLANPQGERNFENALHRWRDLVSRQYHGDGWGGGAR